MTSNKKAELYLFSATILAGLGWLFSKQAVAELPPLAFIGFRFVCAAVIIAPFGMKQLVRGDRQQFVTAGWIGLLQGLSLSLWIYAVSVSDELGVGAFIMSLSMLFVPIWGWMLFKQRPTCPFGLLFHSSARDSIFYPSRVVSQCRRVSCSFYFGGFCGVTFHL